MLGWSAERASNKFGVWSGAGVDASVLEDPPAVASTWSAGVAVVLDAIPVGPVLPSMWCDYNVGRLTIIWERNYSLHPFGVKFVQA